MNIQPTSAIEKISKNLKHSSGSSSDSAEEQSPFQALMDESAPQVEPLVTDKGNGQIEMSETENSAPQEGVEAELVETNEEALNELRPVLMNHTLADEVKVDIEALPKEAQAAFKKLHKAEQAVMHAIQAEDMAKNSKAITEKLNTLLTTAKQVTQEQPNLAAQLNTTDMIKMVSKALQQDAPVMVAPATLNIPIAAQAAQIKTLPVAEVSMGAQLNDPQWTPQLAERIGYLTQNRIQQALIHINPPELGSLTIQIKMVGQNAEVQMATAHSQVKDMITQSMPFLKSFLSESGVTLTDLQVSDKLQSGNQQDTLGFSQRGQTETSLENGEVEGEIQATQTHISKKPSNPDGLVSYFV